MNFIIYLIMFNIFLLSFQVPNIYKREDVVTDENIYLNNLEYLFIVNHIIS
jgi:hypothetical protein